jgi:hypothetical protein
MGSLPLRPKLVPFLNENTSRGCSLHRFESSFFQPYGKMGGSVESVSNVLNHYIYLALGAVPL